MANASLGTVLRHVRMLAAGHGGEGLSDSELLEAFLSRQDQTAFAALVRRHGPMVLNVCRRVLHQHHDAEDAFQATFLILARKAASLRKRPALASWLYGTGYRMALSIQRAAARRRVHEGQARAMSPSDPSADLAWREVEALLEEEIQKLPEKYKAVFVLCCLESKPRTEVARLLGLKEGTVSSRLDHARKQLQVRLARRGVTLSGVLAATALTQSARSAAVPAAVLSATVRAAAALLARKGIATGIVSARVTALAEGGLKTLFTAKQIAMVLVFALGIVTTAAGLIASHSPAARTGDENRAQQSEPAAKRADRPKAAGAKTARFDRYGDPLPDGAIARLGTVRLRPGESLEYLAFSPDGKRLASWGANRLFIWDAATGRELRQVELPDVRAYAFAWLADGRGVAVLQLGDDRFYIWHFTNEKAELPPLIRRPRFGTIEAGQDNESYGCFAVSPDGKLLAAGSCGHQDKERPVHLWELVTGQAVKDLKPPRVLGTMPANCNNLAFSADGRSLFVFSGDLTFNVIRGDRKAKEEDLVVWDVSSGKQRQRMKVPLAIQQGHDKAYAVAPNGRAVVLGMLDGTARLWDVTTAQQQRVLTVNAGAGTKGVSAVAFSPDGQYLVLGGRDNALRTWDLTTGRETRNLHGHHSWIETIAVSRDRKLIASAGQDSLIRIWDATTGADACPLQSHYFWVWGVAISPDGKTAVTASGDRTLRAWDLATGRPVRRIDLGGWPGPLALTPDSRGLAVVSNNRLRIWNVATGEAIRLPTPLVDRPCGTFVFGPDGKTLLTADDGTVWEWEWPVGRLVHTIELPVDKTKPGKMVCTRLALSADGRLLATVSERHWEQKIGEFTQSGLGYGVVDLWDESTGKRIRRAAESMSVFHDVAFTPDGTGLLLAGNGFVPLEGKRGAARPEEALSLLDLATGRLRRTFSAEHGGDYRDVRTFAYSADGRTVASAENDGSVLVFEAATGILRRRLAGHRAGVSSLVFTPDGKRLVTASFDNTGLVWDISLTALARPERHRRVASEAERVRLWADLASTEAETVNSALASLGVAPADAVCYLRERLRPAPVADENRLTRLIADLDSNEFAVREKATKELEDLGEVAAGPCRRALQGQSSAEVRRRLESLLEKEARSAWQPSPERLRALRAVELLEHIGTPEAQAVFKSLAQGAPEVRLTQEAKASLDRLATRARSRH